MKKMLFCIALTSLSGCAINANLYPVEGPLATTQPVRVLSAQIDGILGNKGGITMQLDATESCKGELVSAAGAGISFTSLNLIGQYRSIYGAGIMIGSGSGQNPGRAFMLCTTGRNIDIEFVTGAGTATGFGFGKDNRGNVFRVLF